MLPEPAVSLPASLMELLAVPAVVHRAVIPHVLRAGRRVPGPDGQADGVRHADRSGLSRVWRHDRAHRFFSGARWSSHDLGLAVARLVVSRPVALPVLAALVHKDVKPALAS